MYFWNVYIVILVYLFWYWFLDVLDIANARPLVHNFFSSFFYSFTIHRDPPITRKHTLPRDIYEYFRFMKKEILLWYYAEATAVAPSVNASKTGWKLSKTILLPSSKSKEPLTWDDASGRMENEKLREISSSGYDELCIYIKSIIYSRELYPEKLQLKISALNKLRWGISLLVNIGMLKRKREQPIKLALFKAISSPDKLVVSEMAFDKTLL